MLARRGQLLSRIPARPSFAGRGLVERLRSTAFALLGVTTAMALGLVALISHQSWPYLPVGPIPGYEAKQGKVESGVALAPAPTAPVPGGRIAVVDRLAGRNSGHAVEPHSSHLSGSRQLPAPAQPSPALPAAGDGAPGNAVAAPPAPAPPGLPPAPAPQAAPAPAPPPPAAAATPAPQPVAAATSPDRGHAYGKSKAAGVPSAKPPHPAAPPPPATPTAPVAVEPETAPAPPAPSDVPGKGHAYGHFK